MTLETRSKIGPCELRYARHAVHGPPHPPYGTRGYPRPRRVRARAAFWHALEAWMSHLGEVCPAGAPEILATAGFQVDKGSAINAHRLGIAFDLDGLFWTGDKIPPFVALNAEHDVARYLAIEAGLRQFFGVALGYWYNRAHRCHLHVDASRVVGWNPRSVQRVLFVQLALTHLLGRPVALDGQWGPETAGAVEDLLMEVGPGALDLGAAGAWSAFLQAVELVGWGRVEAV